MVRTVFKSKIHRATLTDANVDYEGSLTIDRTLMDAADIVPWEMVHVWNVTRGTRLQTYALPGPAGSGIVCTNGAAAHGNRPGDVVIIATFAQLTSRELARHRPRTVRVDRRNRITACRAEIPGPGRPREPPVRPLPRPRRVAAALPQA